MLLVLRQDGRALILLTIGLLCCSFSAVSAEPLRSVADLRYGVALYHYFQGRHFDSLSELMVADKKGGIHGHQDNPELIEGSLSLAFGMERKAGQIYDRLLGQEKPLDVRNAAWFYLAKIRYQRGELEAVQQSLDNIEAPISHELVDEMEAMSIQLLIREAKFEEAEKRLNNASSTVRRGKQFQYWRPYLQFNLGAIYARYEKLDKAQQFFSKVAKQRLSEKSFFHKEQLALYDKAFTASAYSFFQQEKYQKAIDSFGRVRQSTPLANDALLGYGWAKAKLGDYEGAIVPWSLLSERPVANDAVQESLIAIPFAYLQLGDTNRAIEAYAKAESVFIQELAAIDAAGNHILNSPLSELLSLDFDDAVYSWLSPEDNYLVKPVSHYLLPLFSLNRFQNSVHNLFDLYHLGRQLDQWQTSLLAYKDLMDYRLQAFRRQQTPEGYPDMKKTLAALQEKRDRLQAVFIKAKADNNVFMLLDEERRDLLDMVESGERNAALLKANNENVTEESVWLSRYRGLLQWSATNDFDERLWQVENNLQQTNRVLSQSGESRQRIDALLSDAPDIKTAQDRIDLYQSKVADLLANNKSLMSDLEKNLRAQLFTALALQRQQVQFYLGEARLAVAQLYDNKYLEGQPQ